LAFPYRVVCLFLCTLLCATAPAWAQLDDNDLDSFGPQTSAEQEAQFDEGVAAYDGGDYARAFEIWLPLAQTGNMSAQRNVANMLRQGLGTEVDKPRAVYFYRRAAEAGLVNAMINLGAMLRVGDGVDRPEPHEAARWFYRASRAGDPRAQYALAVMVAKGEGVDRDRDAAEQLLRLAAAQGLRNANLRLAEAGLTLEPLADPTRAQFNLPPQLEPAPGQSLAAYLTPDGDPATAAADAPDAALRLSDAPDDELPMDESETEEADQPGTGIDGSGVDRLLGGTQ
jgi:TPR repeat protein